ncbi:MAG: phasin family protein [Gammaproteobacteria bacterium]|nr:phasin family protein [Gammaproteobacteria bacterium]
MYQEIFSTYNTQAEKLIVPMQQLAKLSLSNYEKMAALQFEIAQSYVDLGIEQMNAILEVKDPESLQAFVSKQADVARNVGEKMIADAKAVAELGNEFNAETQKLARESMNAVVSQAA